MIKFSSKGEDFLITFQHNTENTIYTEGTVCRIWDLDAEGRRSTVRGYGESYVSRKEREFNPNFVFNKEIGRRYSLTRALKIFPKHDRWKAWVAYFNRSEDTSELARAIEASQGA